MDKLEIRKLNRGADPHRLASTRPRGATRRSALAMGGLLACGVLTTGCADDLPDPGPELAPIAADDAQLTDTLVLLQPDGTLAQSTREVSAAQRQRELAEREHPRDAAAAETQVDEPGLGQRTDALSTNRTCATADLWIYDETFSNRICISGAHLGYNAIETLDLSRVRFGFLCLAIELGGGRCTQFESWAGRVAYVWPGQNNGRLYGQQPGPSAVFPAWGPLQLVDPASSLRVTLLGPYLG